MCVCVEVSSMPVFLVGYDSCGSNFTGLVAHYVNHAL